MKSVLIISTSKSELVRLMPILHFFKKREIADISSCVIFNNNYEMKEAEDLSFIKIDKKIYYPDQDLSYLEKFNFINSIMVDVINEYKPGLMILQGNNIAIISASISCFFSEIPVAYISSAYDQDFNSKDSFLYSQHKIISNSSRYFFCTSSYTKQVLISQNIPFKNIFVVESTGIDAVKLATKSWVGKEIIRKKEILVLIKNYEKNKNFLSIINAIKNIARVFNDIKFKVILPSREISDNYYDFYKYINNIEIVEHLSYSNFLKLLSESAFVITDSQNVIEEANFFNTKIMFIDKKNLYMNLSSNIHVIGDEYLDMIHNCRSLINLDNIKMRYIYDFNDNYSSEIITNILEEVVYTKDPAKIW